MDEKQEIILEWPCNNISIDYSLGNVFVYLTEQAYKLYSIICIFDRASIQVVQHICIFDRAGIQVVQHNVFTAANFST